MYEGIELLRALCAADGPSGFEDAVRNAIEQEIKDCCDTYSCDVLGSLTAVIRGSGRGRVMLSAHMDEVGFMITDITPSGFLKFGALGGIDDAVLWRQAGSDPARKRAFPVRRDPFKADPPPKRRRTGSLREKREHVYFHRRAQPRRSTSIVRRRRHCCVRLGIYSVRRSR